MDIRQILINLISNAVKFTDAGEILVSIKKAEEHCSPFTIENTNVQISVKDTGIGIEKEKQTEIFRAYEQGDYDIRNKYGGSGLGLSIVKGIVEDMRGSISLVSESGKGSTFFVDINLKNVTKNKKNHPYRLGEQV